MIYKIKYTKKSIKDAKLVKQSPYNKKVKCLLNLLSEDPDSLNPEVLSGNYSGCLSLRINLQHRLVYIKNEELKTITIISLWGHY